jgi:hypothetical protein
MILHLQSHSATFPASFAAALHAFMTNCPNVLISFTDCDDHQSINYGHIFGGVFWYEITALLFSAANPPHFPSIHS